jgi:tetratricopeptide (TPR) repeat protein
MSDTVAVKYRAFLSYSHEDGALATWLHTSLENFRIDKDLVGRITRLGPVPDSLRPIYSDDEDFLAGDPLPEATAAALDSSMALIVLCSAGTANRIAANEEVRIFRWRHPDRPVIPVTIDGAPPENFPPALRYVIAPDGSVTEWPITVSGPDLRRKADGKGLGLAKIIAALTGLTAEDIVERIARARRQRLNKRIAAVILVAVVVAAAAAWLLSDRRSSSTQSAAGSQTISAEVDGLAGRLAVGANAPGSQENLARAIAAITEGAASDSRDAQALALLKADMPAEAVPLLRSVAEDKAASDGKQGAAAFRVVGAVAAVADPASARDAYARALMLDPDDAVSMFQDGWFEKETGNLAAADGLYRRFLALKQSSTDSEQTVWARIGLGEIAQAGAKPDKALEFYRAAQTVADRLAQKNPKSDEPQRNLATIYEKIGSVDVAKNDLAGALKLYQDSFAIRERLAKSDPSDVIRQRNLAAAYNNIGDVQKAQNELSGALGSYRSGLAVAQSLATSDPDNASVQRELLVTYIRIGDVQVAQKDLPGAMMTYRDGLAIAERLAKSDPANAGLQFDLVTANWRLAAVGDSSAQRFAYIVTALRRLKQEGRLTPAQEPWLPAAEAQLARYKPR